MAMRTKRELNEKKKTSPSSFWPGTYSEGRNLRKRKSNFSVNFPAIQPSNFGGARSKVALRCKGYAWAPVLWSFDNSGR